MTYELRKRAVYQSPLRLLIVLGVSILIAETGIMYLFQIFTPPSWIETWLDGIFLIILIFPVLYLLVFRPLNHYISELKEADEGLRASEERFRAVTEFAGDAIIGLKSPGIVTYGIRRPRRYSTTQRMKRWGKTCMT